MLHAMALMLIGLGGFAGAISRYLVDGFVAERTGGGFPWGTLAVNASGTFLLGLLFAMTAERAKRFRRRTRTRLAEDVNRGLTGRQPAVDGASRSYES